MCLIIERMIRNQLIIHMSSVGVKFAHRRSLYSEESTEAIEFYILFCLFVWRCWVQKGLKGPLKFDIDSDVGEVPIIEYLLAFALEPCAIHELTLLLLPFTHFRPFLSPSTTPHECARVVCMYCKDIHTHTRGRREKGKKKKEKGERGRERERDCHNAQIPMLN